MGESAIERLAAGVLVHAYAVDTEDLRDLVAAARAEHAALLARIAELEPPLGVSAALYMFAPPSNPEPAP